MLEGYIFGPPQRPLVREKRWIGSLDGFPENVIKHRQTHTSNEEMAPHGKPFQNDLLIREQILQHIQQNLLNVGITMTFLSSQYSQCEIMSNTPNRKARVENPAKNKNQGIEVLN